MAFIRVDDVILYPAMWKGRVYSVAAYHRWHYTKTHQFSWSWPNMRGTTIKMMLNTNDLVMVGKWNS